RATVRATGELRASARRAIAQGAWHAHELARDRALHLPDHRHGSGRADGGWSREEPAAGRAHDAFDLAERFSVGATDLDRRPIALELEEHALRGGDAPPDEQRVR